MGTGSSNFEIFCNYNCTMVGNVLRREAEANYTSSLVFNITPFRVIKALKLIKAPFQFLQILNISIGSLPRD